jgi:DNA repair exonuclease SbcCD ATPase subunit
LNQNENDIDQKNNQLNDWISNYNSKNSHISIDDISVIYNSNCDWDDIRNKKEILQNKKTSTSTLLTNAQNKYEEHLKTKPQNTKNELLEEHKKLKQQNNNDLLIEAKTRKRKHDDAIEKIGEKKQKLEQTKKDTENWKAINDAIGGDGKTLRKIAQCYTLGFLVEYANAEIRRFNTRFELIHVKNSLGIRVIDHERADDIRETTSLSGGETFIISLGLALGLSSISSRNISLDNLFIDEGFGTLDPESLATVIDSLAMLQSSNGKKVCVISHTDTMSERITTQIRVIKNGNTGSSHIEIHS